MAGIFGTTPAVSGVFGAAPTAVAPATGVFGVAPTAAPTAGVFGAAPTAVAPATGVFGAAPTAAPTAGVFGAMGSVGGTGSPPYAITTHVDKAPNKQPVTTKLHSISCMPAFVSKSVEELRAEDYAKGVKSGAAPAVPGVPGVPGVPVAPGVASLLGAQPTSLWPPQPVTGYATTGTGE